VIGGEQAAAYEAATAYRAITLRQPPRTQTRALASPASPPNPARSHGRLLMVAGGTTAAAVAALGLLLSGAPFSPVAAPIDTSSSASSSPGARNASPERPVTDSSAPSPQQVHQRAAHRTTPQASHPAPQLLAATPPTVLEVLSRMRRSVDEGLAASEVRVDVAVDLDNVIGNLQAELARGAHVDVDQRVGELRTKIAQRVREGGLAQNRADDLTQALSDV
jgi:serine/threonine-protein kinase